MANSVDPDQTASIGAVCSGSTLFASICNSSVMPGNYLQQTTSADDFSRRHFQMHFFLGALRIKRVGYNMDIMRQSACLVVNPIAVDSYGLLFNYTTQT